MWEKIVYEFRRHKLFRRLLFVWMMVLTYHVFLWAMDFATHTQKTGMEVAAIIAAITGPLSALQGYVFKMYNDARKEKSDGQEQA